MDRITIRGIDVFGRHGVLAHERTFGQRFTIDVELALDLQAAANSDRLEDTVDYGALVASLVEVAEGEPVALIETLAGRLLDVCFVHPRVLEAEVTVHKPHAPVGAVVDDVAVALRRRRDHRPAPHVSGRGRSDDGERA